jgi:hypothetical protein
MARWITRTVARIRAFVLSDRVRFTRKARQERRALPMDIEDAYAVLRTLRPVDGPERRWSSASRDWLYVFRPIHGGVRLYVKVALRDECVVVSFHEDGGENDEAP